MRADGVADTPSRSFRKGEFLMSKTINCAAVLIGSLLVCAPAFSQSEDAARSDVSAQFIGTFVHSSNQNGVQESASDSGGVLASYRFFFSKHHGVEANYSWSRSTATYAVAGATSGVNADQHE